MGTINRSKVSEPGAQIVRIEINSARKRHLIKMAKEAGVSIDELASSIVAHVIDDDVKNRKFEGLIGVQVHVGPPMKVEFRSFRLKTL
jgi:hypothetical protein